jgi:hypothetical protein
MSTQADEPSEAELRAALEEQLRHITAADVIVQTAVSLVNLAGRRLGLTADTEPERDLGQVRDAIDASRALLPILERNESVQALGPLRDALASLQMEYARQVQAGPQPPAAAQPGKPSEQGAAAQQGPTQPTSGPAQESGRLWVPGSATWPRK